MRIRNVVVCPLRHALQKPFCFSQKWVTHRTALLVKIETDEGITGWGEAFCHDAWPALATLIERVYKPHLVGADPLAREVIWSKLYNWTRDYGQKGLTTIALSAIDIALWDILGRATRLPVSALLGGNFRDRVPAYATGMYPSQEALDNPALIAEEAATYITQGFQAVKVKVGFGVSRDIECVRRVREAIGEKPGLMVDANHAYDVADAIALGRAIEPYRISWFEEPVVPEDIEGYRAVRQALSIPIAGGEAEFTRYGFRNLIAQGAVDILQPDICSMGGLSEAVKVAALASAWHVRYMPHVWGTGIAIAASLHFMAAMPDQPPSLHPRLPMLELDRTENPLRDQLLAAPLEIADGWASVPTSPGLGVEPDARMLAKFAQS
jgi:D-galactarolactone cycloisomerase